MSETPAPPGASGAAGRPGAAGTYGGHPLDGVELPGIELLDVLHREERCLVRRGRRRSGEYLVKIVRPVDDAAGAAFRREASLLARLTGGEVPTVRVVGQVDTVNFLVMDQVTGPSLRQVLSGGRPTAHEVAELGAGVADALAVVHRAGLIHGRLGPDTVVVRPDGTTCLLEATAASRTGPARPPLVEGVYRSPERSGTLDRPVDSRADLYSLGVMLYELAAGRPPFTGTDVGDLVRAHLSEPVPPLSLHSPGLPPSLGDVVERLLAKDPEDRYAHAAEVAVELRRIAAATRPESLTEGPREPGAPSGEPAAASGGPTGPSGEPTGPRGPAVPVGLVGREEPWRLLTERWARATAGEGGVVALTGPSGIGKTRLAEELAAVARAAGASVLSARCLTGDTAPLAPVRACVEGYLADMETARPRTAATARGRLQAAAATDAALLRALSPALGRVLAAPDLVAEPGPEGEQRFLDAIAGLVTRLAGSPSGGVLYLDDAHHCDPATVRLLHRLAPALAASRLLVVLTVRTAEGDHRNVSLDTLAACLGTALDTRLELGLLSPPEVTAMISRELGGHVPGTDLVHAALSGSAGNPLLVEEFLRAVLDAGLLLPSWGRWRLDGRAADALRLPGTVADLLVRQLDGLDPVTRRVLTVAAVIGSRCRPETVLGVCLEVAAGPSGTPLAPDQVRAALAECQRRQLLEREGPGLTFVQHRVRGALLATLDGDEGHRLHAAIADRLAADLEALTAPGSPGGQVDPDLVYALAGQLRAAGPLVEPRRTFEALVRAGTTAVREFCPHEALAFLHDAEALAGPAGVELPAHLHAAVGSAAVLVGDHELADERLGLAVALTPDVEERVGLICQQVHARLLQWRSGEAVALVEDALAELGCPQPTGWRRLPLALGWLVITALVVVVPRRWRFVDGAARTRRRLVARLALDGASAGAADGDVGGMTVFYLRSIRAAARLGPGPGPEYACSLAGTAWLANTLGMHRLARRLVAASARAVPVDDPVGAAHAAWLTAGALDVTRPLCDDFGVRFVQVLAEHGRWLDADRYLLALGVRASALAVRGLVAEAEAVLALTDGRVVDRAGPRGNIFATQSAQVAAVSGRTSEAQGWIGEAEAFLTTVRPTPLHRLGIAHATLQAGVEREDTGADFDRAAAALDELDLDPGRAFAASRPAWLYLAWGRLAQHARAQDADERAARAEAVEAALAQLERASKGPLMSAFREAAIAAYEQQAGRPRRALRRLHRLDAATTAQDAPLLEYEVARTRARAQRALGRPAQARRHADLAAMLAQRYGWAVRERSVRAEFALDDDATDLRRGDAADSLRAAAVRLASSLDPAQVTDELVDVVTALLPASRAVVVRGPGGDAGGRATGPDDDPVVASLFHLREPAVGPAGGPAPRALGEDVGHWMSVPLRVRGRLHGLLLVGRDDVPFPAAQVRLAAAVGAQAALALENALLRGEAQVLTTRDLLTGLPNRRAFVEHGDQSWSVGQQVAAVMVDIDQVRVVNDIFGHDVGDEVIREVAQRLSAVIRDGDVICRYSGEEFGVLLAAATQTQAEAVARRLHDSVGDVPVLTTAGPLQVTVSVGLAVPTAPTPAEPRRGAPEGSLEGLLRRADDALDDAKRNGRDRVSVSTY